MKRHLFHECHNTDGTCMICGISRAFHEEFMVESSLPEERKDYSLSAPGKGETKFHKDIKPQGGETSTEAEKDTKIGIILAKYLNQEISRSGGITMINELFGEQQDSEITDETELRKIADRYFDQATDIFTLESGDKAFCIEREDFIRSMIEFKLGNRLGEKTKQ